MWYLTILKHLNSVKRMLQKKVRSRNVITNNTGFTLGKKQNIKLSDSSKKKKLKKSANKKLYSKLTAALQKTLNSWKYSQKKSVKIQINLKAKKKRTKQTSIMNKKRNN